MLNCHVSAETHCGQQIESNERYHEQYFRC